MDHLLQLGELFLLIILTLLQVGRWSKTQEQTPALIASKLAQVEKLALEAKDIGIKARHTINSHLKAHIFELDKVYARKENVELHLETLANRIEYIENRFERR